MQGKISAVKERLQSTDVITTPMQGFNPLYHIRTLEAFNIFLNILVSAAPLPGELNYSDALGTLSVVQTLSPTCHGSRQNVGFSEATW